MNAAARAIHQSNLFSGQLFEMELSRSTRLVFILLFTLLISSLAVVYVTNEFRSNVSHLQQLEQESQQLHLQYGQLLLEQASWATPGRVEALAIQKLQMHLPNEKEVLTLQQHEN